MDLKQEAIIDHLKTILIEDLHLPVEKDAIDAKTSLFVGEISLDSLDMMELINKIDEAYGVDLIDETIEDYQTLWALSEKIIQEAQSC